MRTIHILSTACIVLLVSACTGLQNGSPTPSSAAKPTEGPATPTASFPTAKIISVTILPEVSEIKVGDVVEFRMEVQLSPGVPGPGPPPFWQIDNPAVAAVTAGGTLTALAPGEVTLSVRFRGASTARILRLIP
jgi:Big-like domain-containing protein